MFQVLDTKQQCAGFYYSGELYFDYQPPQMSHTWDYSPILRDLDMQYASLYCEGKSLTDVCPEHLKPEWERVTKKIRAFLDSFFEAKLSLQENCIFDLIPQRYLKEYYDAKSKICEHVFKEYPQPPEYAFYREFNQFVHDVSTRQLELNRDWLATKLYDVQAKKLWEKINAGQTAINYNLFGSVTGRLTVTDDSFPILTLNKRLRGVLLPKNDWFVELDLNAAELRVARALLNHPQIEGDHHGWSVDNIFNGELTRTEAKETATSWLYGSHNKLALKYSKELEAFYNKEALKAMYWVDGAVHTPFNRAIPADDYHVISYLNQSTLIDLFHRQILKMNKLLAGKKSFVSFLVHDCLVLDLAEEDKGMLVDLVRELSATRWGVFPVNVKIGHNYGEMKKVKLKV